MFKVTKINPFVTFRKVAANNYLYRSEMVLQT